MSFHTGRPIAVPDANIAKGKGFDPSPSKGARGVLARFLLY
jgi:hypothetical protein